MSKKISKKTGKLINDLEKFHQEEYTSLPLAVVIIPIIILIVSILVLSRLGV